VTSLITQRALFTTSADLGYCIFVVANEKFTNVFVRAFRKSDDSEHHVAKFGCRLENCRAATSLILRCLR